MRRWSFRCPDACPAEPRCPPDPAPKSPPHVPPAGAAGAVSLRPVPARCSPARRLPRRRPPACNPWGRPAAKAAGKQAAKAAQSGRQRPPQIWRQRPPRFGPPERQGGFALPGRPAIARRHWKDTRSGVPCSPPVGRWLRPPPLCVAIRHRRRRQQCVKCAKCAAAVFKSRWVFS